MQLRKKNLQMILLEYQTLELFFDALDHEKRFLSSEDKKIIDNSIVYYSNLFELKHDLEPDVDRLSELANYNLLRFKRAYRLRNSKALLLMITLLTYNLKYVGSIRFLGAS